PAHRRVRQVRDLGRGLRPCLRGRNRHPGPPPHALHSLVLAPSPRRIPNSDGKPARLAGVCPTRIRYTLAEQGTLPDRIAAGRSAAVTGAIPPGGVRGRPGASAPRQRPAGPRPSPSQGRLGSPPAGSIETLSLMSHAQ